MTFKGVGPCCGYKDYYACTNNVALALDDMLSGQINKVYARQMSNAGTNVATATADKMAGDTPTEDKLTAIASNVSVSGVCNSANFSDWLPCLMQSEPLPIESTFANPPLSTK